MNPQQKLDPLELIALPFSAVARRALKSSPPAAITFYMAGRWTAYREAAIRQLSGLQRLTPDQKAEATQVAEKMSKRKAGKVVPWVQPLSARHIRMVTLLVYNELQKTAYPGFHSTKISSKPGIGPGQNSVIYVSKDWRRTVFLPGLSVVDKKLTLQVKQTGNDVWAASWVEQVEKPNRWGQLQNKLVPVHGQIIRTDTGFQHVVRPKRQKRTGGKP